MSLDAFKSLDPSIFEKMVDQAESEKVTRESTKGSGFADGIPEAFLPAGKHTLRIFADPNLQMYRMVRFFTVKDPYKRIMDPRFYKQTDGTYKCGETVIPQECIERLWELGSDLDYSHGSRTSAVFYGMVIDTDSPSEYWEKGKLYVIKGPGRFEDAWMAQMASMRSNPEVAPHIAKSLNPTVPGWGWSITVVKGAQGSVSMTPTFMKDYPAAEIEEGTYLPLKDLVVKDGFSMEDLVDWKLAYWHAVSKMVWMKKMLQQFQLRVIALPLLLLKVKKNLRLKLRLMKSRLMLRSMTHLHVMH